MPIKPIIFSGPMVKAILDGDKTMTRRVIKPQPKCRLTYIYAAGSLRYIGKWAYPSQYEMERDGIRPPPEGLTAADKNVLWTPPYHGDDILWVRETWATVNDAVSGEKRYLYAAGAAMEDYSLENGALRKWRPSIHMPREAARIFLRVTKVSVERLRDITDEDAEREGMRYSALESMDLDWLEYCGVFKPRYAFAELWNSLRKDKPADLKQYGWNANPWVWVISFERCEKPEAW